MVQEDRQNSENWSVASLFVELRPVLVKYLSARIGDSAEAQDLAQEAYLRLLRVPDPDLIEKPHAYLFRIAANLASEMRLKRGRQPHLLDDKAIDSLDDGGAFERTVEMQWALQRLQKILSGLPPLYQAVLILRRRDGYSHAEIARKLGISVHTVHRYLTRAVAHCRADWNETIG